MSDSLSAAQFPSDPSAPACPECGSAGKKDGPKSFGHVETPPGCKTYTWSSGGDFIARDVHTRAERDARADKIDARLRKLNPFKR